jgi:Nicotinate phosphoribosyltransferase (NAPRTase) N-terminal domain
MPRAIQAANECAALCHGPLEAASAGQTFIAPSFVMEGAVTACTLSNGEGDEIVKVSLDGPLLTDLYELTMLQAYFDSGMNDTATFELFVRALPPRRNFLMAAGLEQLPRRSAILSRGSRLARENRPL